ncbi:MAG: PTS transporter subunit EIIC [Bacillota bacterium]|nr:PTS transporter subunit EIIC [Bacillota bacterium]
MSEFSNTNINDKKNIIQIILSYLDGIFQPILPAITAAGMLQGLNVLLSFTGLVEEGTSTFIILNSISNVVFYFLPILIGLSAAKIFDVNEYVSISVILVLFHPDLLELFFGKMDTNFLGLPILETSYSSSVFPAIFIVWAQKYVEKFSKWLVPEIVQGVFSPLIDLGLTTLLGLIVLGPLGNGIGIFLGGALKSVGSLAHFLIPTLLGGFGIFAVMTGAHYPLFPLVFDQLGHQGFEDFFAAGMVATNIGLAGAVFAVVLLAKDKKVKSYSISAFITAMLGTSQPGIYGVALKYKSALVGSMLAGFIGGAFAGLMNFVSYAYVNPGLAAIPVYMSPDGSLRNLVIGLITMAISFGIGFLYTFIVNRKNDEINM